jgi:hypothetical protein
MRRYLAYLKYVLRHKWFVFWACLELGVPIWISLLHDWDKFLPGAFIAYARHFYHPDGTPIIRRDSTGYYKPLGTGDLAFDRALASHLHRNKHHWEHWALAVPSRSGQSAIIETIDIPKVYLLEMLADWRGAGRAQGKPDTQAWYAANKDKMRLHSASRAFLEMHLKVIPPSDEAAMVQVLKSELS